MGLTADRQRGQDSGLLPLIHAALHSVHSPGPLAGSVPEADSVATTKARVQRPRP